MIVIEKEFFSVRSPSSMFGTRKRFRAIVHVPAKCGLHSQEALFDVAVIMNEILDAKFHAISITENHSDALWKRLPASNSEHFGITTQLNRIVRLGRQREFRVPNLVLV